MDFLRSFFRLLFAGKLEVGRAGCFFRLEENAQRNRRPQETIERSNRRVLIRPFFEMVLGSILLQRLFFVLLCFCTIISALESKASLLFDLITSAHH